MEKEQLKEENKDLLEKITKLGRDLAEGSQANDQLQCLTEKLHKEQEDHQLALKQLTMECQHVQELLKATLEKNGEIDRKKQESDEASRKLQQQLQEIKERLDSTTKVSRKYDKERRIVQYQLDEITHQRNMLQWDLKQCTTEKNALEQG